MQLTKNLTFMGEIVRKLPFENFEPKGTRMTSTGCQKDHLIDDSALVHKNEDGITIITGCSHSGICNIMEMARAMCNDTRIRDVIGGFHFLNPSDLKVEGTIDYLKKHQPQMMHPCHCTKNKYKFLISEVCPIEEIGSGSVLEY
jgi:7,8-dihydropterin-6-yl-methyl-4-(beta-D-ribofuranosyl)aminobenzene 5'-phosphate synthase